MLQVGKILKSMVRRKRFAGYKNTTNYQFKCFSRLETNSLNTNLFRSILDNHKLIFKFQIIVGS